MTHCWAVWVDLKQRSVYQKRGPLRDGEIVEQGWFDRARDLDKALDGEPLTEENFGTDPDAVAAARAMEGMAGGPAPLRGPQAASDGEIEPVPSAST